MLALKMLWAFGPFINHVFGQRAEESIKEFLFMQRRSRLPLFLCPLVSLLIVLFWSVPGLADSRFVLTPFAGLENGGLSFGGNLRDFIVPNLGGEIDGGIGDSLCQDCRLSETTLTANLVYEIHPLDRISVFAVAGGGIGFIDLSSPESSRTDVGLFDIGLGGGFFLNNHLSLTLESRWFVPFSGQLPRVTSGSLTTNRISLGLSTTF